RIVDVAGLTFKGSLTVGKDTGNGELAVPDSRPVDAGGGRAPDQDEPPPLAGEGQAVAEGALAADGIEDERRAALDEARGERRLVGDGAREPGCPAVELVPAAQEDIRAGGRGLLQLEVVAAEGGDRAGPAGR